MAKIVAAEEIPAEGDVTFTLAAGSFDLGADGYETDDRQLISEAAVHPWLNVEYDESEAPVAAFRPGTVPPEEDALSTQNSVAFDEDLVAKARAEALGETEETEDQAEPTTDEVFESVDAPTQEVDTY